MKNHCRQCFHLARRLALGLLAVTALTATALAAAPTASDPVADFTQDIDERKTEIDKIKRRIEAYEGKIKETREQTASLRQELQLVENEIAKKELDIELTKQQIAKTNLEIQRTAKEISLQGDRIRLQEERIGYLLRLIYQRDQVSYLEVLLNYPNFSEFFDYYQRLEDVQQQLQRALVKLQSLQAELKLQQAALQAKKSEAETLKAQFENQRQDFTQQALHQVQLIRETEKSEKKFGAYVQELKLEQQQINQEIGGLEKKIRQELEKRKEAERLAKLGIPQLAWPTDGRYITAYFHDPEYPYRYIFEHPALDIRTPQGSPVYAAEGGYVGRTKNGGAKGYSYLMIIHANALSTVYGHVSAILVAEGEFVTKGQTIARSGGAPGTPGAGRLTTGAHLHFEVRKDGIPVNPQEYLP